MNGQRPSLFVPALIGGAIAGVLSGIPVVNCLCCLWIIGGGTLAAALWARELPGAMTSGDGALVGAFAGIVAAVANSLVGIPFTAANLAFARRIMDRMSSYMSEIPTGWEEWFESGFGPVSIAGFLLGFVFAAVIFAVFGALGGVLGSSLFGRKTGLSGAPPAAAPPPPPQGPTA